MTKAYYGSRFSQNMTRTPEGYLICHNVPIARTGWQEYLADELGQQEYLGQTFQVYRSPEEVFSPATIASFEGKPATDNHPPDWVRPDNVSTFLKGIATNVRQSKDEPDLLLADLIIYDAILINEVENGKREVSCGYDCIWQPLEEDGKYQQVQIRGNHVAIVVNGRAGNRVAIKDEKPIERRERKLAGKITKNLLAAMGFKSFVADASPEEIEEATKAMAETKDEGTPAAAAESVEAKESQQNNEVLELCKNIMARLEALEKSDKQVHQEVATDALSELEAELEKETNDADGEEAKTIPVEEMQDSVVVPEDEKTVNPIPSADAKAATLMAIKAMKPIIAAIADEKERKRATDALAETFRSQIKGTSPAQSTSYADIAAAAASNVKKNVDSAKQEEDQANIGKDIAKKHNPHYKNR